MGMKYTYLVNIDNDPIQEWSEVYRWLEEHVGIEDARLDRGDRDWFGCQGPHKGNHLIYSNTSNFYFKREADAMFFRIRWG